MCLSAAYWAKIERITFAADRNDAAAAGFNDAFVYEELLKAVHDRTIPMQQLLRDEALQTFELWTTLEEKTRY
jgi:tRNA(Arg) A34 adenosine deaminase TadA